MNPATVQLIIALLPIADKLIFDLGGKLVELDTKDIKDPNELVKLVQDSKAQNWPELAFVSGALDEGRTENMQGR